MSHDLREEFAIENFPWIRKVFGPPGLFAWISWGLGEGEFLFGFLSLFLNDSKMVVVEEPQRFDGVGDRDPAVADEKQVFAVFDIRRRGEIVRAEIDPRTGLVEIDHPNL